MKKYLTVNEVTEQFGIPGCMLRRMIQSGEIKALKRKTGYGGLWEYIIPVNVIDETRIYERTHFDPRTVRVMQEDYLARLDELEEQLYDNACLLAEMRERIQKGF